MEEEITLLEAVLQGGLSLPRQRSTCFFSLSVGSVSPYTLFCFLFYLYFISLSLLSAMDAFGADDRKQLAKLWSFKRKLPLQDDKQPEEDATSLETASVAKKEAKKAKFLSRGSFASRRNNTEEERRVNLAKACADRLAFSQFRSINEYLYSHSSEDAQAYMDEEMFDKYHSAYEEIAAKWPVKPIDEVIKLLEKVYSSSAKGRVLVDMGCGSKPLLHRHSHRPPLTPLISFRKTITSRKPTLHMCRSIRSPVIASSSAYR